MWLLQMLNIVWSFTHWLMIDYWRLCVFMSFSQLLCSLKEDKTFCLPQIPSVFVYVEELLWQKSAVVVDTLMLTMWGGFIFTKMCKTKDCTIIRVCWQQFLFQIWILTSVCTWISIFFRNYLKINLNVEIEDIFGKNTLSSCPFFKGLFKGWTQTVSAEYKRRFDC